MSKEYLSIGEFSKLANINIKCLRYYDQLGILKPILIADSGYRYYSPSQIILVDAIQICIDTGIPLKHFFDYYDEESGGLHYNKLFEDGSRLAELKYRQIKSRLARLSQMQNEIKRCEEVLQTQEILTCSIPTTNLWIEPYQPYESKSEQLLHFYPQICQMEKYGITPIYDTGRMIIHKNGKDEPYIYITVEIADSSAKLPQNILCLPTSEYFCRVAEKEAIFHYDTVFPALKGQDIIVIEAELYTPEYVQASPKYELRCLPFSVK